MRKILVDENIQAIAKDYNQELLKKENFPQGGDPISGLKELEKQIKNIQTRSVDSRILPYLSSLIVLYKNDLNTMPLSNVRDRLPDGLKEIPFEEMPTIKVDIDGKEESLYNLITKAMRYDVVRREIILPFIYRMGIKSCLYCNSQFAVTTETEIDNYKGYYELDHVLPKSKYPFLCTNFYNLVPVCSSCNKRKSDDDDEWDYHPYAESKEEYHEHEMVLTLNPDDLASYIVEPNIEKLKPHLQNADGTKGEGYVELFNKKLRIDAIYAEHSDVVEEILWRHKIYSKGYVDGLDAQMKGLGISGFDFRRYILGAYPDEKDAHKRPLTILAQDIWKQLEGEI